MEFRALAHSVPLPRRRTQELPHFMREATAEGLQIMKTLGLGETPLSIPAFRRAWIGFTLSAAGDAASWIALVTLCMGPVQGSLPLLAALYTAPVAIGGLCAGWALDRFDRRRLIVADSIVRGAAFATIPIAMNLGPVAAHHLYAVAVVYGSLKMVSLAGFPTLIPSLVPVSQLAQANALESMCFGLASFCGAALAGVGIATVGPALVVTADAASYLALAIALLSVRGLRGIQRPAGGRVGCRHRGAFASPLRLVVTHPVLRTTTIIFALFNIGQGCLLVFLPHRALDLGFGSGGYGYLVAASTAGQLLATAFLARRPWRRSLPASIIIAQIGAAAAVIVLVVRSTALTLVALGLLGMLSAPMTAWAQTLRMRVVPREQHGRLFALLRTVMQATPPLGASLGALLLPQSPTITVLAVGAVMGLPALFLATSMLVPGAPHPPDGQQPAPVEGVEGAAP
jgi:MFS family permease